MQQTPLMTQYYQVKTAYPDTILLFRVGDFYETFEEDAKTASRVLGITLTKRANGAAGEVPLAGFPHHALDTYMPKLVRAGFRVAVCEQMENPKFAKGIVKREVTEVVTPGVAFSDKLLDHKKNNYLMAVASQNETAGIAFCDVSTGEFYTYEIPYNALLQHIEHISPAEILAPRTIKNYIESNAQKLALQMRITRIDDWIFNLEYAQDLLTRHFASVSLKGFGIERLYLGVIAAGTILHYLNESQRANLPHIRKIAIYNPSDYMILDNAARRNLEIIFSMQEGTREGSLISILDFTETPMGGRLLKKWISAPLITLEPILQRQNAVDELLHQKEKRTAISSALREIGDLERLISKVCTGRANPRDIVGLRTSFEKLPVIRAALTDSASTLLQFIHNQINPLDELQRKIHDTIVDHPPLNLTEGGVIRNGISPELDELRDLAINSKDWIANLQKTERERTGISSLKVNFNKVFGYYIEISNANKDKIPADYIRKQTLVNCERFITPDLKEYEEKILHAEEKIYDLETELFNALRFDIAEFAEDIQKNARLIAQADCLNSLAECAARNKYIKPVLTDDFTLEIIGGRHPVVEQILPPGVKFTPNDTILDNQENQIVLLTGPNMAGKSVYLRQIGLMVLLAQIGSFVPAERATIGIVDRIFTRVGASDNISAGESTFLVEMQEAANILNNATNRSLILLDEIGRGTSTFDGISIAWSITEYLHEMPQCQAKTVFATHYHELNELSELFPRIRNFKVEVREHGDKVIFLHKVSQGRADHSYGIQVAQMAGLPKVVTDRAKEILMNLESKELTPYEVKKEKLSKIITKQPTMQLSLFEFKDEKLRKAIDDIEVDSLTPIQALNKLYELKNDIKKETPEQE
ncbi:MAG: DNA mismatch repair protein MutS [Ignavibacteria bacterium]|nr:DNA mismatch repair protein MutS [Ignavibacteria bacterium]